LISRLLQCAILLCGFVVFGFVGIRVALTKSGDLRLPKWPGAKQGEFAGDLNLLARDKILDTSVIIDGRIADIAKTHFVEGRFVVPRFVLAELQTIADSEDALKRNRGRRGLDILKTLQRKTNISLEILERDYPEIAGVDAKKGPREMACRFAEGVEEIIFGERAFGLYPLQ
ncbi:MAG: PIN/TRAM domain-containing protein, partial [Chloroflexi bacterium]|nr:PIN/TRAM domain-containing protein [Chloroflexota bacterium]